jgi:hypothetical protein
MDRGENVFRLVPFLIMQMILPDCVKLLVLSSITPLLRIQLKNVLRIVHSLQILTLIEIQENVLPVAVWPTNTRWILSASVSLYVLKAFLCKIQQKSVSVIA